jgi:hypothetical protein
MPIALTEQVGTNLGRGATVIGRAAAPVAKRGARPWAIWFQDLLVEGEAVLGAAVGDRT